MAASRNDIPPWLATPEQYRPGSDRDGFISRSLLSVSSMLAFFRLDDGRSSALSPSAPAKLVICLACVLLTSLARNYLFVLVLLAALLLRCALLPRRALVRVASGAVAAAGLCLVVMLPAALVGQPRSALTLSTKALVCTGITLTMAVTTPVAELTASLRHLGVPGIVILTIDLALRSIVRLGETAAEVLAALSLRSVGRNRRKGASMAGVGGVVLIKAGKAAQDTYDAMRCRGFDGEYHTGTGAARTATDAVWACALAALLALFLYLQGLV